MNAEDDSAPPAADALAAYRAKRSPDRTPEPFSGTSRTSGRSFVVHKHAARNLHFDLRLEIDGVLRSWAVPRGPSYDMADKRLAMHVEDHPLDYRDFEGLIPAGNYGAGGMIIWDRGEWVALEDVAEGFVKGKLLFELRGQKLRGKWTLVKIKRAENEWLLIKERDGWVRSPGTNFDETSVVSGLTVEEAGAGITASGKLREAVARHAGVARAVLDPRTIKVMLAVPEPDPFTDDDWIFELKLDGYRLLAAKSGDGSLLLTRNGNDYTAVFPEVARAVASLPFDRCILDGEVVVLDADGKPSFSRLQQRGRLSGPLDVARACTDHPATFYAFDLIAFDDHDLRALPTVTRKQLLRSALPASGAIKLLDHVVGQGEAFMNGVRSMKLEGIIAKKADAPYKAGRSDCWLKIKTDPTSDFVIVGFTSPKKSRGGFGALQLADRVEDDLVYAGRVGTGFDDAMLRDLLAMLTPIIRPDAPCLGPRIGGKSAAAIPEIRTTTWVEPVRCCEVRFREWTPDGLLRHAAFVALRPDKSPLDCVRDGFDDATGSPDSKASDDAIGSPDSKASGNATPNATGTPTGEKSEPTRGNDATARGRSAVQITNPGKVYWPETPYTKGDLIAYYQAISPWLLPYLRDRPVVLTRFPDGIDGKSFYQKDAPDHTPAWLRTVPIWSSDTQRDVRYFVCDDLETLTYLANLGTIPLHLWMSRIGTLEKPDFCVIDLDPKDAPFSDVVRCALVLRSLCERIGMPSYVKTTGKSGLHILVPLGRQCTYEQSRTLGELIARVMLREVGDIATITRHVNRRGSKVYLDYLQNIHGQLIVSPFSVRPLPGAPVSMPLHWDEVDGSLSPRKYTIANAVARMEALGADPCRPAIDERIDLVSALQRLSALMV